jgi:hypothetical protein
VTKICTSMIQKFYRYGRKGTISIIEENAFSASRALPCVQPGIQMDRRSESNIRTAGLRTCPKK